MGNGVNEDHWDAEGSGADMKLSKTLDAARAAEAQDQCHSRPVPQARRPGRASTPAQTGSLLSGAKIQKGAIIKAGITVDQMIANHIGQDTAQSSIVLACEQPMTGLPRDELLDGLQLAHLVAESRIRRCRTKSIRRWRSTTCSRTAAACAT